MSSLDNLNHFNGLGDAHMVDVGGKAVTIRAALAAGEIVMAAATLECIESGRMGKGDVLGVARIAAIQATKKTWELIPLAHPLLLTGVEVELTPAHDPVRIVCRAEVRCAGQTGVEMEALTAVSVGLLTIYDMCKAIDRGMLLQNIGLLRKDGGKTGLWERDQASCLPSA